MKKVSVLALLLSGCSSSGLTGLSAVEKLLVAATSGTEEKSVSSGDAASPDDVPADQRPDAFRECDASATYSDLFGRFDANANGVLDTPEEKEVDSSWSGRAEGPDHRVMMQWGMLLLTYDLDGSGSLDASERATLLSDFTERCQNLQALLVEQFDADGDGVLSEEEKDTARETLESKEGEHHPGCDGMEGEDSGHERGGPGGGGPEGGPPEDAYTVGGVPVPPPLLEEFDADGDGSLSETEIATLRSSLRERVRSGAPLMPPPPEEK